MRNLIPWGRHVRGLCPNVPQVEGEGLKTMRSSCERAMSECATG